jgi:8-amino-7-oxononanoate synthase
MDSKTQKNTSFDWMEHKLTSLKKANLYRKIRELEDVKTTSARLEGRDITLFCGNDYLGLSQHPKVVQAATDAIGKCGAGAGSARLIAGTSQWHRLLEEKLAAFLGKERALLFSSGYLANIGVLTSLAKKNDLIAIDKLSHASLIDAARASQAILRVYPHRNVDYLDRVLTKSKAPRKWIVTDSVFSMDGDLAPLQELVALKKKHGASLAIDEAHGFGVFGKQGKGVAEQLDVLDQIDAYIGTCSKAVGSLGGFVAGSNELVEILINTARTFIFDTALPPSICAASFEAVKLIENEPAHRIQLWENIERLQKGLKSVGRHTVSNNAPILLIIYGDGEEECALKASDALLEKGFLVPAIRFPTVARGEARLRVTVSAVHTPAQIEQFLTAIS